MNILYIKSTFIIFLILPFLQVHAQVMPVYSKATVYFNEKTVQDLGALGIDITHGTLVRGISFTSDLSEYEIQLIEEAGFEVDILEYDMSSFYALRQQSSSHEHRETFRERGFCPDLYCRDVEDPRNFIEGSMGGYYRLQEINEELFKMHFEYPNLMSLEQSMNGIRTHQNRDLGYYKITSNVESQHPTKRKVLHTSLHHAREGISVVQMIYFMWYLLENYGKDPIVTYLLDKVEFYFVPVLNPDGYMFNERHYFQGKGFGMHRGNMRRNITIEGDTVYGVDLNRNYGFNFGLNNVGSSNNPRIETYRGPHAFSEPETQAIKWLCETINFDVALNHHSFGELVLVPFADNVTPNPDFREFYSMGKNMSECNNYKVGESLELLSYESNGSSDDWMYGDISNKNPIFAFTPEIGHDGHGFWPHFSEIRPLCRGMIATNIYSGLSVLNYARVTDMSIPFHHQLQSQVKFMVEKVSLLDGPIQITLEPLDTEILNGVQQRTVNVEAFDSEELIFEIQLNPLLAHKTGGSFKYAYHVSNGAIILSDTSTAYYIGKSEELFREAALNMNNWRSNGVSSWGIDHTVYFSPFSSIGDSPNRTYEGFSTNTIELRDPILIAENTEEVYLTFRAKWEMDYLGDFVQLSVSTNGLTGWTPVCGLFTQESNTNERSFGPIYTGFQNNWVQEFIDLSEYKGHNIFLRWQMVTADKENTRDYWGFNFDDLRIVSTLDTETSIIEKQRNDLVKIFPNPSDGDVFVQLLSQNTINEFQVELLDAAGRIIHFEKHLAGQSGLIHLPRLAPGFYTYRISHKHEGFQAGKIIIH